MARGSLANEGVANEPLSACKVSSEVLNLLSYLKLTDACQTKARSKKSTGIIGNTSTRGSKGAYASGNFASKKAIVEYLVN